jgi:hypothetical protein
MADDRVAGDFRDILDRYNAQQAAFERLRDETPGLRELIQRDIDEIIAAKHRLAEQAAQLDTRVVEWQWHQRRREGAVDH